MAEPLIPAGSAGRVARPEGGAIIKPNDNAAAITRKITMGR